MKNRAIREIKKEMRIAGENWRIPLMEFVDDFRRTKDPALVAEPFSLDDEKIDSIVASTVEYLCDELNLKTPDWIWSVPSCEQPWFVSGCENLKAMAIAESPVFFRRRKIFVLENFLSRV
ncbi:MAG: hypothetical protein U5R49_19865 [Deltaproteobacteria bacterium]|nr:hypothetical protein [Deltaproteobacteria bacterium]